MKLEYRHRAGGALHQGPSGIQYEFIEDEQGRRVAEVDEPADIERFTGLVNREGVPLFVEVVDPVAESPVTENPVAKVGRGRPKAVVTVEAEPVVEPEPEPVAAAVETPSWVAGDAVPVSAEG